MTLSPELADLKARCLKAITLGASLARIDDHLEKLGAGTPPQGVTKEAHLLAHLDSFEAHLDSHAPEEETSENDVDEVDETSEEETSENDVDEETSENDVDEEGASEKPQAPSPKKKSGKKKSGKKK